MSGRIGNCSICTTGMQRDAVAVLTKCGHSFHHECIHRWFQEKQVCPMCRLPTSVHEVVKLYLDEASDLSGEEEVDRVTNKGKQPHSKKAPRDQGSTSATGNSPNSRHQNANNLYVRNLDDSVTDALLRQLFEKFGNITSAKIMLDDDGRSKKFGFVCFERSEDASRAIVEMHDKIMHSKHLYVTHAQRKEYRRAQLSTDASAPGGAPVSRRVGPAPTTPEQNSGNMRGTVDAATHGGFVGSANMPRRPFASGGIQLNNVRNSAPRWNGVAGGQYNLPGGYMVPNQYNAGVHRPQRPMRPPFQPGQQRPQRMPIQPGNVRPMANVKQFYQGQYSSAPQMRQPTMPQQQQQNVNQNEPLSAHFVAQAPKHEQKQIIGKRLYPLIERLAPDDDIGKITVMMLEMDNSELLMFLENEQLLAQKVSEACSVLRHSNTKDAEPTPVA